MRLTSFAADGAAAQFRHEAMVYEKLAEKNKARREELRAAEPREFVEEMRLLVAEIEYRLASIKLRREALRIEFIHQRGVLECFR